MPPKVLITSEYFAKFSPEARTLLVNAGLDVIDNPYGHTQLNQSQMIPYIGDANAIICDLEPIDRSVIDAAPVLKIIARRGVGIDSVDWKYAQEKGIEVARTLGVVEMPVAELVMGYVLELSRHISSMSQRMHEGKWERQECHSVAGRTLGIIGMGRIASQVARLASAFQMKVLYYDVTKNEAVEDETGARYASLKVLLAEADFVTLHTPLTDETRGMVNADLLLRMKKGSCLINTARGAIVDAAAVRNAIEQGLLSGAAIDVYDREPETESVLKGVPGVILTPHIGTFTQETFIRMDVEAAKNVIRCLIPERS